MSSRTVNLSSRAVVNGLILLAAVVVFAIALVLGTSRGEFGGSDAAATEVIQSSQPAYEPWFQPLWTQPGGEVESGLFAIQAALGAGLVGFALGTFRERRRARDAQARTPDDVPR